MSEYTTLDVQFEDGEVLVDSLKEMGLNPEVHESGLTLENNYSRKKPTAHVVVRKGQFRGYGDLGFEKTKTGYTMHIDDSDVSKVNLARLNRTYGEKKVTKIVNQRTDLSIQSRTTTKDGHVRMRVKQFR